MTMRMVMLLRCDICLQREHRASPGLDTPFAVRTEARSVGWTGKDGKDVCPPCGKAAAEEKERAKAHE